MGNGRVSCRYQVVWFLVVENLNRENKMRAFAIFLPVVSLIMLEAEIAFSETLYPAGSNISSSYQLSALSISLDDTLIITRTVVNHESFALTGLYFSENLPSQFEVVGHAVSIDGRPISYLFVLPLSDATVSGFDRYEWIVDEADSSSVNNAVEPGESITLQLFVVPNDTGLYLMPLHSAVFYGSGGGFFSTDSSLSVWVSPSVDIDEPGHEDGLLPDQHFTARAYPNPFNGPVNIAYSGIGLAGEQLKIEVFNVLGQKVYGHTFRANSDRGTVVWEPSGTIGSGTYFYRLISPTARTGGKLLLLK